MLINIGVETDAPSVMSQSITVGSDTLYTEASDNDLRNIAETVVAECAGVLLGPDFASPNTVTIVSIVMPGVTRAIPVTP